MIQQEKKRLREQMKHDLQKKALLYNNSYAILNQLELLPAWMEAKTVLLYAPLPHEPNLLPLLKKMDHRFFFPRIEGSELTLFEWSPTSSWVQGAHHIQEPDPQTWRLASLSEIDLALIPGLAFDKEGGRLGWGKGYFDRLLASPLCHALKIGVAWPWQIVAAIPKEPHDIRMDIIMTSKRVLIDRDGPRNSGQ